MTVLLITGFGPFPGAPVNPTAALVARLTKGRRPGARRIGHVFATSYAAVDADLPRLLAQHKPDAVVMFGLAARRRHVSIETQAKNRVSRSFPDASGRVASRSQIAAGAAAMMRGRAPMARLLAAARGRCDVRLTRDAGRYLCNYVYWRALEAAAEAGGPRLVVFVHVPLPRPHHRPAGGIRIQRRRPTLADLTRIGEAILTAVAASARH